LTVLADIKLRLGKNSEADEWLKDGCANAPPDWIRSYGGGSEVVRALRIWI
jgi:hypothetical protein